MGGRSFDELARGLAAPMSRSRALRTLAVGLGAAAIPGITARRAGAIQGICTSGGTPCGTNRNPGFNLGCCIGAPGETRTVCCPRGAGTQGSGCCQTGWTCGGDQPPNCICNGQVDPRTGDCNCTANKVCGNTCCREHERCDEGECVPCEEEDMCGRDCCAKGSVCRNKSRSLCCVASWKACTAGLTGVVKCCPPTDTCCFNRKTKTAKCCGPGVECDNGVCKCKKGEKKCGEDCCKQGEICSKGRCCKKGQVNCDGKCCKPHLCVPSGGKKVCCPIERIATPASGPVCCPAGTVPTSEDTCCPPGNPDCCGSGDLQPVCGKGRICVNGKCA